MEERGFCPSDCNCSASSSLGFQPVVLLCRFWTRQDPHGMSKFLKINIFSLSLSLPLSLSLTLSFSFSLSLSLSLSIYIYIYIYICILVYTHACTYRYIHPIACFPGELYHPSPLPPHTHTMRLPSGSVAKNPPANARDAGSIPGAGRSRFYPWGRRCRFCPWDRKIQVLSLGQEVQVLSLGQEMQVLSLGQEDLLEKGMATHSSILAWKISWKERSLAHYSSSVHGIAKCQMWLSD